MESSRSISCLTGLHRNTINENIRLLTSGGHSYEDLQGLSDKDLSDLFPQESTIDKNRYET